MADYLTGAGLLKDQKKMERVVTRCHKRYLEHTYRMACSVMYKIMKNPSDNLLESIVSAAAYRPLEQIDTIVQILTGSSYISIPTKDMLPFSDKDTWRFGLAVKIRIVDGIFAFKDNLFDMSFYDIPEIHTIFKEAAKQGIVFTSSNFFYRYGISKSETI